MLERYEESLGVTDAVESDDFLMKEQNVDKCGSRKRRKKGEKETRSQNDGIEKR